MSKVGAAVVEEENEGLSQSAGYEPESPFIADELPAPVIELQTASDEGVIESPFRAEFIGDVDVESEDTALFQELLVDVFDEEFDDAVEDLVGELAGVYEQRFSNEAPTPEMRREAERQLEGYLEPLREEAHTMLERMAAATEAVDIEAMPEDEVDALLDPFEPEMELPSPAMEEFLGKLFKKAKKAVKKIARKAKRVAKTVAKVAGKLMPVHLLLRKLRGLVKPLLKRVLRFAINKLPKRFRPIARTLSRKLLKLAGETGDEIEEFAFLEQGLVQAAAQLEDAEAASPDSSVIQAELDGILIANFVEGDDFESSPEFLAYVDEEDVEDDDPIGELEAARERFVNDLVQLEDGQDPTPQVEQFVQAILPALRIGIRIVGRKRVVNFLAKLVARLIRRFVGRQMALPLSRSLVDAGLGLLSLEAPGAEAETASAELLAATIEETVERLVADAPDEAFEDEELLETYVGDAFENAVAANFPATLVRRDLRDGRTGAWVVAPRKPARRYKRYTRVFDVTISAAAAKRVQSFGGQTLASFLQEQLGLPIDRAPVKARLHVYEAIRGTRLSHIARSEGRGAGPAAAGRGSTQVIHPLTCAAAGVLIPGESGLCRDVPSRFLRDRRRIKVGQRFYVLEIAGAKLRASAARTTRRGRSPRTARPVRASEVRLVLDMRQRRLVIHDFLSESSAQDIAQRLRRGARFPAIARLLRTSLEAGVKGALSGNSTRHLRLIREVGMEKELPAAIAGILRLGGDELGKVLLKALQLELAKLLKARFDAFSKDFVNAANASADGVTLVITVETSALFKLLSAPLARIPARLALMARQRVVDSVSIDARPGYVE